MHSKRPPNPFIQFSYLKLWWKCSIMQILLLANIGRGFIHWGGSWQSIHIQPLLSSYLPAFAVYILLRRRAKIEFGKHNSIWKWCSKWKYLEQWADFFSLGDPPGRPKQARNPKEVCRGWFFMDQATWESRRISSGQQEMNKPSLLGNPAVKSYR